MLAYLGRKIDFRFILIASDHASENFRSEGVEVGDWKLSELG